MDKNKDFLNGSGCKDLTAYEVLKMIQQEEKRTLIDEFQKLARRHGYRIVGTIRLKEID